MGVRERVWMRDRKTKRLHWFNFGLHLGAEGLHEGGWRVTLGLHGFTWGSGMVGWDDGR